MEIFVRLCEEGVKVSTPQAVCANPAMVLVKGPMHGQGEEHRVKFRSDGAVGALVRDSIASLPDGPRSMIGAGHWGVRVNLHRLGVYCVWEGIGDDVVEIVRQCVHCVEPKAENVVHGPLGEVIHRLEVGEELHFDHHCLEKSDEMEVGVLVGKGYDLSRYVWLEPAPSYSGEVAARTIL